MPIYFIHDANEAANPTDNIVCQDILINVILAVKMNFGGFDLEIIENGISIAKALARPRTLAVRAKRRHQT